MRIKCPDSNGLVMRRAYLLLFLVFFHVTCSQCHADLIVNVVEAAGNVRIECSGTLDMSLVAFTDTNVSTEEHSRRFTSPSFGQPFTTIVNL